MSHPFSGLCVGFEVVRILCGAPTPGLRVSVSGYTSDACGRPTATSEMRVE